MDFSYWAGSGQPWADILESCRRAEADGWHGIWVPDHFMPPPEGYGSEAEAGIEPELAPVLEAWTLQAALAALVPRVRIGAMVNGNTLRDRVADYADAGVDEIVVPDFNHPVAGRVETFERFRADVVEQFG